MAKIKPVSVWVSPEFKKVLKANASLNGMPVIDYTQKLSEQLINNYESKKKEKRNEYKFKF